MARRRHTPEQVVRKLREADRLLNEGQDVAEVARHLQVSEQTYHRWRNQYGGMKADDVKRLKELEVENTRLKRIVADKELEVLALNVDHHEAAGKQRRWRRPIRRQGPIALEARLPLDRIFRRLRTARVPATVSHHAGTFVCNHVFYEALAAFSGPCGFVHVPPFKAMSRPRQIGAIRAILSVMGGSSSPAATR